MGRAIRDERRKRGMTQAQLAAAVGEQLRRPLQRQMVSQWETGHRTPVDWRTLAAIGTVLGIAFVLGDRRFAACVRYLVGHETDEWICPPCLEAVGQEPLPL